MAEQNIQQMITQILGHDRKQEPVPLKLVDQLVSAVIQRGSPKEAGIPSALKARVLAHERRFLEALVTIEQTLAKSPSHLEVQLEAKSILSEIAVEIEKSAQVNPMMDRLGQVYEKLLQLGMASMRLHASVLKHYLLLGDQAKAADLGNRLRRAAPHLIDLSGIDPDLDSIPDSQPDSQTKEADSSALCTELLDAYSVIQKLQGQNLHEEVIKKCRLITENIRISVQNRDFFRYQEACALDYLGRSLDALAIFLDLNERHPAHFQYARSLRIVVESVATQASQLMGREPSSAALRNYANILDQVDYCPVTLKVALSLLDVQEGRSDQAKERIVALIQLSPYDTDYLGAGLQVAQALGDVEWTKALLSQTRAHLAKYPCLIELHTLVERYSSNDDSTSGRVA